MYDSNDTYKIVLIGDSNVGKTCILWRAINNVFKNRETTIATIHCEMKKKINNTTVNFKIFDTAGMEKYRSINKNFYRDAHAIIIVYSFDDIYSLVNVQNWYNEALEGTNQNNTLFYLVANKFDLYYGSNKSNVISIENGNENANKLNMKFICTSAKTGQNIDYLFDSIANDVYDKFHLFSYETTYNDTFDIANENHSKNCFC